MGVKTWFKTDLNKEEQEGESVMGCYTSERSYTGKGTGRVVEMLWL